MRYKSERLFEENKSSTKLSIHGFPRLTAAVTARHKLTHHPKFHEENYTFASVKYRYRWYRYR
jgi:hypothetical protein